MNRCICPGWARHWDPGRSAAYSISLCPSLPGPFSQAPPMVSSSPSPLFARAWAPRGPPVLTSALRASVSILRCQSQLMPVWFLWFPSPMLSEESPGFSSSLHAGSWAVGHLCMVMIQGPTSAQSVPAGARMIWCIV